MMRILPTLLLASAAMASPAEAQRGLALEVRGGAGVGNYAEAAGELEMAPRPSFGATVSYAAFRTVEVYAGYSRTSFGCGTGFCSTRDVTFTSSGVDAGVRVGLPGAAGPWVRTGIVSHSLDVPSSSVDTESAGGTGFELGGGVQVRLGRRLAITPGIRYVRYGAANDDGVAMLVGDVGLRMRM